MNEKIKQIATETFKKLPTNGASPEQWIDTFVIQYTRAILFEATEVIRSNAKDHDPDQAMLLKATAVDVLEHFGL